MVYHETVQVEEVVIALGISAIVAAVIITAMILVYLDNKGRREKGY